MKQISISAQDHQTESNLVKTSGIKSWPQGERPRERLLKGGAPSLTDAELLALLLRSGVKGCDAVTLARELLREFGGLRGLLSGDIQKLLKIKGLGPAKASSLLASIEIAKRQLHEQMTGRNVIRDPESVAQYLMATLRDKKREVFKVLFLNKANEIIADKDLFEGTLDESPVYPREILKAALDCYASAVILVHNHPSGNSAPSSEDRSITRKISECLATCSIKVLDHLIIGRGEPFSFRSAGLII